MVREIRLTPAAEEKIRENQQKGKYYKVELKRAGCCSYSFVFNESREKKDDILVETESGISIPVSYHAQSLLRNILIDYKKWGFLKFFNVSPV